MDPVPFDPNEIEALRRRLAELEAGQPPGASRSGAPDQRGVTVAGHNAGTIHAGTAIATQGAAAIQGSVQAGGHFIGRDFIQFVTQVIQGDEDPEEAQSVIAAYLHALVADLAGLKLGEIDLSAREIRREPLQLADVYVPLATHLRIPEGWTLEQWLSRREDSNRQGEVRAVSALEALAAHRELTLLGKPGSGKSTFGASVLLTLAQVWQGHPDGLAGLGKGWTQGAPLPVRVILRRFADQLPPGTDGARAGDLWHFIGRDLEASGYGLSAQAMRYVERIARRHGALILLDGLDECGTSATRARVRGAVQELMRTAGPKCRFLLTARPYAWPGGPDPARGVYGLAAVSPTQHSDRGWPCRVAKRRQPNLRVTPESEARSLDSAQHRRLGWRPYRQPNILTGLAMLGCQTAATQLVSPESEYPSRGVQRHRGQGQRTGEERHNTTRKPPQPGRKPGGAPR